MDLVGWIVAGGLAGWGVGVAWDDDDAALLVNILIGSLGALGGATTALLLRGEVDGFDVLALLAALCGAFVLLGVVRVLRGVLLRRRSEVPPAGPDAKPWERGRRTVRGRRGRALRAATFTLVGFSPDARRCC